MEKADNPPKGLGQSPSLPSSVGLLIAGGGIMGLWAAVKAERMGIDTLLVDAGSLGCGASGGLLGALMPYMPDRWCKKKQFQFEALVALEEEVARLESDTGLSAAYRRCGRIIPLPKLHLRKIALRHEQDAEANWNQMGRRFHWHVLDTPPVSGWLAEGANDGGFVHDTMAGRVSPRALCAALTAFLRQARHVRVVEDCAIEQIDAKAGTASLSSGHRISFGHCIVSAGHRAFPLISTALHLQSDAVLGQPVKGQAALLKADVDGDLPVIFLNGIYIVPHENGMVAVGSTSEDRFEDASATDGQLDDLITRARLLVPSLADAPVVERWAGLRPKAIGRDPMVGVHPDYPRLISLTGGFKISFGLAHRLADEALAVVCGADARLPQGFTLVDHINVVLGDI